MSAQARSPGPLANRGMLAVAMATTEVAKNHFLRPKDRSSVTLVRLARVTS